MHLLLPAAVLVAAVQASFPRNINYGSPSLHHPGLGISLHRVQKRNDHTKQFTASQLNFTHGVASGDPYPNSVILWTRIAPSLSADTSNATVEGTAPLYGYASGLHANVSRAPVCVEYKVSTTKDFADIADKGTAFTSSDIDYTVKVEAKNLRPFTTYYYQFNVCGSTKLSSLGRTKTTPAPNDKVDKPIKLAVFSCSNLPFGFFNAIGNVVRKDSVDFVIHLGDYLYEYKNGEYGWGNSYGRIPQPDHELFTLYDYRTRIAQYHADVDMRASHENFAWIPVWDDHEVADNTWKAGSSELNNTEESFVKDGGVSVDQRKMNAVRAYFEWMPLRQVEMDDNLRIWRSFQMGSLFDLVMLDTRQYDRSITDLYWNTHYIHEISNDAGRSLMGSRQENWFYNELSKSNDRGAQWRIIGSQIVFSRMNESIVFGQEDPLNYDSWDGYQANRNRTLQHLYDNSIGNNIFLAGDSHASWVSDVVWLDTHPYDPATGKGSIGAEFAGSAVSSPCPYGQNITIKQASNNSELLVAANRELQWQDLYYRGYFELSIDYDAVNATFFGIPDPRSYNGKEITLASFSVQSGENRLHRNPSVGGGVAESGSLKGGKIVQTNKTVDTNALVCQA